MQVDYVVTATLWSVMSHLMPLDTRRNLSPTFQKYYHA